MMVMGYKCKQGQSIAQSQYCSSLTSRSSGLGTIVAMILERARSTAGSEIPLHSRILSSRPPFTEQPCVERNNTNLSSAYSMIQYNYNPTMTNCNYMISWIVRHFR